MNSDRCTSRIVHIDKVEKALEVDLPAGAVEKASRLFKLFADPSRLRMLHALEKQEMCVCDLAAFLGSSESAVSHQLRLLRTSGLVLNRRQGTILYYRLSDTRLVELISLALTLQGDSDAAFAVADRN